MTLIELLEEAAREIDCPISDLCTAEDPCERRPMAARLRAAASRLREEMERANLHPLIMRANVSLNYVNNGPLALDGMPVGRSTRRNHAK